MPIQPATTPENVPVVSLRQKAKEIVCVILVLLAAFGCGKKAQEPDSITIDVPYEPDTLDPHARSTISSYCMHANLYEPLVSSDANMKLQPCLARFWENPDPNTWVFHLEPSAKFHSGKPLRAADVVFSFERLLKSNELEVAALLTEVSEVKALDPLTVLIRTRVPVSIFLNKISFVMMIPSGSATQSLTERVDGTGPYKLVRWKRGEIIQMIRNENYWRAKAEIPQVTFYVNRSPEQAMQDLASGKCQLALCNSKKLKDVVQSLTRCEMILHDSLSVKYLAWDLSRDITPDCPTKPNPFKNKLVRQAIHLAVDRQKLVSNLPIYAVPATQVVPPFVFGYNTQIASPVYDPAQARSLLADAGLPNGFEVTLTGRQILKDAALQIKEQLQQVGIRIEVKILPDHEFFGTVNDRKASFFLSRLSTTTGDASDVLEAALHSPDVSGHYGIYNWGDYSNPQVDQSIEQTMGILKVEDRRVALAKVMSTVMSDLPWVPLYLDQEVYAIDKSFSWQPRNDGLVLAYDIKLRR